MYDYLHFITQRYTFHCWYKRWMSLNRDSLQVLQKYFAYMKLALNAMTSWAKDITELQLYLHINCQLFACVRSIILTCRWKTKKVWENILSHYFKIWHRLYALPLKEHITQLCRPYMNFTSFSDSAWSNVIYVRGKLKRKGTIYFFLLPRCSCFISFFFFFLLVLFVCIGKLQFFCFNSITSTFTLSIVLQAMLE